MKDSNKKIADKVFKAVMESIKTARKFNKEHNPTDMWSRKRQQADIQIEDDTTWEKGYRAVRGYIIKVNDKEVGKVLTHYDVREVMGELGSLLTEQKKAKGWGGLNYMTERTSLAGNSWDGYDVTIIPKVCFADAPCKEYKSLVNYLNKYGKAYLRNYELFSAAMGGKRGRLWDEYGERMFLDNKPKKCGRILEELRKYRTAKDLMICKRGHEDYIDEIDRKYSEYHEVECEGERRYYLEITIKAPQGKVKYTTKIY